MEKTGDTRAGAPDQRVVAAALRHLRLYGFVPSWHSLEATYRPHMSARQLARAWLDGRI
jgi:hypothetical protein